MLPLEAIPTPLFPGRTRSLPIGAQEPRVGWRPGRVLLLVYRLAVLWAATRVARGRLRAVSDQLRDLLDRSGGAWVKAGQLVAMRRDLFPIELCDALATLQDRATGFPGEEAVRILEEELGTPRDLVFSMFEERPIAAGSIGQV